MPLHDDLTRDQFDAMLHSLAWQAYERRLAEMLEDQRRQLENETPEAKTQWNRGYIAALRRLMLVPEQILNEMED